MDPETISVGRRTCRQQIVNSVAHEPPGLVICNVNVEESEESHG
jgi:hypothetical protein